MPEFTVVPKKLGEICRFLGAELVGDPEMLITGISGIKEARKGDITFVANPRYSSLLKTTRASAVIVGKDMYDSDRALVKTENPYVAFTKVMAFIVPEANGSVPAPGVHPSACVDKTAKLGKEVSIQANVVVDRQASVGDGTVLLAGVYVGPHAKIGKACLIHPNVSILDKVRIGDRVIIHSGTVIGSDGFGFAPMKGVHHKVPQIGTVVIEDDVEIGANSAVDRATIGETRIGKGSKLDNLVQIAHNVILGENCIIVAQVGISGSTVLENNVTIAGQSGVAGHITVGAGTIIAAKSGVTKSIPPNQLVSGFPAKPHMEEQRIKACINRLPKYAERIARLEKELEELKKYALQPVE